MDISYNSTQAFLQIFEVTLQGESLMVLYIPISVQLIGPFYNFFNLMFRRMYFSDNCA